MVYTWTAIQQSHFHSRPCPFHPASVFLFNFFATVLQCWQHLDDSCQGQSGFKMSEHIGARRTHHQDLRSLIWFIEKYRSCRAADDSKSKPRHNLSLFFLRICTCGLMQIWMRGVMESTRGRTAEWRDQVSSWLNPLWPRDSILYRLNAATPPFCLWFPARFLCREIWYEVE